MLFYRRDRGAAERAEGVPLRRQPLVATAVFLTLAVGIGATSAIFTVVDRVLLRPLPCHEPERLVAIHGLSYRGEFVHLKEHARTFDVAGYTRARDVSLTGRGEPLRLVAASLSPEIFPVLGAAPMLGRAFALADGRPGGEAVILLSAALWRTPFGSDPAVVGGTVRIDGIARTIAGVMPPRFAFPSERTQVWLPLVVDPSNPIELWSTNALMVARLRPGVDRGEAGAELRAMVPAFRWWRAYSPGCSRRSGRRSGISARASRPVAARVPVARSTVPRGRSQERNSHLR